MLSLTLLPLVPTVCKLPCLVDWHITLIVIGALALVVGTVISIIGIMVSCQRTGEFMYMHCTTMNGYILQVNIADSTIASNHFVYLMCH